MGKLARWLRMMGYDTLLFDHSSDDRMIRTALNEGRIVLTKDTRIMERRVVTTGRLKTVLITSDEPEQQIRQVIRDLQLESRFHPFSLCLECNQPLVEVSKQEVEGLVPEYVFQTQEHYVRCPSCQRIYWRGTHWQAMVQELGKLKEGT